MSESFHRSVAEHVVGATIAGVLVAALLWAATKSDADVNPALAVLALLASGVGGVAFFVIYQRYAAILTRRGPQARAAYDRLRHNLAAGGLAADTYARRLTAALDAVDHFFGDAGMAGRTLFPHAFGLRRPASLWSAPAFDRCLLLAMLYPIGVILVIWTVSGQVGPAEHALGVPPDLPGWRRAGSLANLAFVFFAAWRAWRATGWAALAWSAVAVADATAMVLATVSAGSGAIAGVFAVGATVVGVGAVAVAFAFAFAVNVTVAFSATGTFTRTIVLAVVIVSAVFYLNNRAERQGWLGRFQALFWLVMSFAWFAAADTLVVQNAWPISGSLLLGLLTQINAPFDWASLGLTRALLRRGLELGGWWPYLLALADALLAAVVIAMLTVVSVIGVQALNTVAAHAAGDAARVLPFDPLFDGIASRPAAPEFWWVYAMLLSTMIPSLVNLTIGGASLLRGIPWITALVLRNMPERGAPPTFERTWMTLLLTLQVFLGGLLGIAAQGFLVYVVIGLVLPWFGLDLLELARAVAAADVPGTVLAWFTGTPGH